MSKKRLIECRSNSLEEGAPVTEDGPEAAGFVNQEAGGA